MNRRERRAAAQQRQHRTGEIRATQIDGQPEGTIEVLAVAYGVVDDYGTRFVPGVFNESLEQRLPTLAWAHSWNEPIGRATAWREADEGLYLRLRLDLHDDVPRARQAWAQIESGTLDDVSVGFLRLADRTADDGVEEIVKAELDEVSVVLRGAVPGAKVLATRAGGGTVDVDAAVVLGKKMAAGEVTFDEAVETLRLLSDDGTPAEETGEGEDPPSEIDAEAVAAAEAEADAALADATDRSRR